MGFWRSMLLMARRREPSPETNPPNMTLEGIVEFRRLQLDDRDGYRRGDLSGGRRLISYTADSSDTTSRQTHSSQVVSHGGRLRADTPGRTSNSDSGGPPRQHRDMFSGTQRPRVSERMAGEEIGAGNNVMSSSSESDSDSDSGSYAPRFRDVDVEFDHNHVHETRGGGRAVTGMHAGRDLKARIHHNRFGR